LNNSGTVVSDSPRDFRVQICLAPLDLDLTLLDFRIAAGLLLGLMRAGKMGGA
jgi:hypothetical protein